MANLKIAQIVLNSENFESFEIPPKFVEDLQIGTIVANLSVGRHGEMRRWQSCQSFYLRVQRAYLAKMPTDGFDGQHNRLTLDKRLVQMPDLVDIDLVYTNGQTSNVYLPWRDGEFWDINGAMKATIDQERGTLEVRVA